MSVLAAAFERPGTAFRVRADATGVVRESNESNNEVSIDATAR